MKTISKILVIAMVGLATQISAQQTQGALMVMDMKPVLQMEITAPEQINFVFDEKNKFRNGIVKEKATIIKVTSTVKWDLYAVGRSTGKSPNGNTFWDQEKSFGSSVNSIADIPLSLLELRQHQKNTGANTSASYADYSSQFSKNLVPNGANSLYVSNNGTPTPPSKRGKYIAGHSGMPDEFENGYMPAGSYVSKNGLGNHFEYVMDYRILPGYPAIFPNAFNEDASLAENIVSYANANTIMVGGAAGDGNKSFAEPGVYTMTVQYVLLEDQ